MAVYEYRCEECEKTFTVVERISEHDDPRRKRRPCPECGSRKTRQLYLPFYAKTSVKS